MFSASLYAFNASLQNVLKIPSLRSKLMVSPSFLDFLKLNPYKIITYNIGKQIFNYSIFVKTAQIKSRAFCPTFVYKYYFVSLNTSMFLAQ